MGERVHNNVREVGKPYDMSFGELREKVHFGSFAVVVTSRGALFETYTGYHVWTTPFVTGRDGDVRQKTLYGWLMNLIEFRRQCEGHEGEPMADIPADEEGHVVTNGEMLEHLKVVTEANLMQPVVIFGDANRAIEAAVDYEKWLTGCYERLVEASARVEDVSDMDEMRAIAEIEGDMVRGEVMGALADELGSV